MTRPITDCHACNGLPSVHRCRTTSERIREQDAPTVPVPRPVKLPPISHELAAIAFDRMADPLNVHVYEHVKLIEDSYAETAWMVLERMRTRGDRMLGRTLYIVTEGQCYRAVVDDNDVMPEPVPCDWCVQCLAEHRNCPLPNWCEACLSSSHSLAECLEAEEWEAAE